MMIMIDPVDLSSENEVFKWPVDGGIVWPLDEQSLYHFNGFPHAGILTALGLLDDDSKLPDYGKMSADSDCELSYFDDD